MSQFLADVKSVLESLAKLLELPVIAYAAWRVIEAGNKKKPVAAEILRKRENSKGLPGSGSLKARV